MTDSFPVLSVLIWLPIFGGVMVWAVGDDQAAAAKRLALGFTVATLAAALALVGAWAPWRRAGLAPAGAGNP